MLQADVEELRARLEEKNRMIDKKTQNTLGAVQDRNRMQSELAELKDHMDIKDRKINVLQRKVCIIVEDNNNQRGQSLISLCSLRAIRSRISKIC